MIKEMIEILESKIYLGIPRGEAEAALVERGMRGDIAKGLLTIVDFVRSQSHQGVSPEEIQKIIVAHGVSGGLVKIIVDTVLGSLSAEVVQKQSVTRKEITEFLISLWSPGFSDEDIQKNFIPRGLTRDFAKAFSLAIEFVTRQLHAGTAPEEILETIIERGVSVDLAKDIVDALSRTHVLYNEGVLFAGKSLWNEALVRFREVVRVQPGHVRARCQMGRILLQQQKKTEALAELQQAVQRDPNCVEGHRLLADATLYGVRKPYRERYHQRMVWHCENHRPNITLDRPTFFADRQKALRVVREENRLCAMGSKEFPVPCYYTGDPFPDAPSGLIHIPLEPRAAETFLVHHKLPLPADIDFDPSIEAERVAAEGMISVLDSVAMARWQEMARLIPICQSTCPEFLPGQPLRVYIPASWHTGVWTIVRDLAQAFREHGCEVLHVIEQSKGEAWGSHHWLQACAAFNPHVLVDYDGIFTHMVGLQTHPDVFKVLWIGDNMPYLQTGNPLPWGQRDLIYSAWKGTDTMLNRCGAAQFERQLYCYDPSIFYDFGQERKKKIVLVGSSYEYALNRFAPEKRAEGRTLQVRMLEMFEAGEPVTDAVLDRLAGHSSYTPLERFVYLWAYVIRNQSARWLCELSNEIEVEIYGDAGWSSHDAIRPFYKGQLAHGTALAAVYNEAQYVLLPHHHDLNSLRMFETSACGAIPVVYDCRYLAEKPHWDEYCLWYRTKQELRDCLTKKPPMSPQIICAGKTYGDFVQRVLRAVESRLSGSV